MHQCILTVSECKSGVGQCVLTAEQYWLLADPNSCIQSATACKPAQFIRI
jgi:hypothetical protein